MAINTKTNSTALSYLSIITNKTVEMITMKMLKFVDNHTATKELVDFLRFYEGTAVIYVNREGCEWQVEWVNLLGRVLSDRAEVLVL